jgi:hypothetical protein
MWFHSYDVAHQIRGSVGPESKFLIASKQGRLTAVAFYWNGEPATFDWSLARVPVNNERAFPMGDLTQQADVLGFDWIANPKYAIYASNSPRSTGLGPVTTVLNGGGPVVPYWFAIGLLAALSVALLKGALWRSNPYVVLVAFAFAIVLIGLSLFLDAVGASRHGGFAETNDSQRASKSTSIV